MTMNFRTIKQGLEDLLTSNAAGRFKVVGHQRTITNVEKFQEKDDSGEGLRTLQVYSYTGDFPKGRAAGLSGPITHEVTYRVELYDARATEGDLAALEAATDAASRLLAKATFKEAARLVDDSMDEFIDIVIQIIMNPLNQNLGLDRSSVVIADRWVPSWSKDSVVGDGEVVGLTALMTVKLSVIEEIGGDTNLTAMTEGVDISVSNNTNPELESADEETPVAGNLVKP